MRFTNITSMFTSHDLAPASESVEIDETELRATRRRLDQYEAGTLPKDEEGALRRAIPSSLWMNLLRRRAEKEKSAREAERSAERAKLIADCLAPLDENSGTQELAMRQIRLLAAILERTS